MKLDTDPTYKLIHNMRRRLLHAVKGYGDKYDTTMNLVCNSIKLREYIEAKFTGRKLGKIKVPGI